MLGITVTIEFGVKGKAKSNAGMPVRLKIVEQRCPGWDWKGPGFSTGAKFYAALKGPGFQPGRGGNKQQCGFSR